MDPDQTAHIGAVCSGSTLFASLLNSSVMSGNYLQQMTFSDVFFLGALRVKTLQMFLSCSEDVHVAFTILRFFLSLYFPTVDFFFCLQYYQIIQMGILCVRSSSYSFILIALKVCMHIFILVVGDINAQILMVKHCTCVP